MPSHVADSVALVRDGDCRPSDVRAGEVALEAAVIRILNEVLRGRVLDPGSPPRRAELGLTAL